MIKYVNSASLKGAGISPAPPTSAPQSSACNTRTSMKPLLSASKRANASVTLFLLAVLASTSCRQRSNPVGEGNHCGGVDEEDVQHSRAMAPRHKGNDRR